MRAEYDRQLRELEEELFDMEVCASRQLPFQELC